jgi:hypothetical protein
VSTLIRVRALDASIEACAGSAPDERARFASSEALEPRANASRPHSARVALAEFREIPRRDEPHVVVARAELREVPADDEPHVVIARAEFRGVPTRAAASRAELSAIRARPEPRLKPDRDERPAVLARVQLRALPAPIESHSAHTYARAHAAQAYRTASAVQAAPSTLKTA